MASLLELRKEAEKLGIENYAQYSKSELQALVEKAKEVGLDYSDEDYEKFTKADITKLIQEKINA